MNIIASFFLSLSQCKDLQEQREIYRTVTIQQIKTKKLS